MLPSWNFYHFGICWHDFWYTELYGIKLPVDQLEASDPKPEENWSTRVALSHVTRVYVRPQKQPCRWRGQLEGYVMMTSVEKRTRTHLFDNSKFKDSKTGKARLVRCIGRCILCIHHCAQLTSLDFFFTFCSSKLQKGFLKWLTSDGGSDSGRTSRSWWYRCW